MLFIIINLKNWAFYSIGIREKASADNEINSTGGYNKMKCFVNMITVLSILATLFFSGLAAYLFWTKEYSPIQLLRNSQAWDFFKGITELAAGILFFILGMIIICDVKEHFIEFYDSYKCQLITATLFLSIPLIISGAFNILDNGEHIHGIILSEISTQVFGFIIPLIT